RPRRSCLASTGGRRRPSADVAAVMPPAAGRGAWGGRVTLGTLPLGAFARHAPTNGSSGWGRARQPMAPGFSVRTGAWAGQPSRPSSPTNPGNGGRMSSETEIRRFRVDVPEDEITDLRRRIAAMRWPSRELVTDRSQGVQLATIQELARYW